MIGRLIAAAFRAFCVGILFAAPALVLPTGSADGAQLSLILGAMAGLMVFVEYAGANPAVLEFRHAAPYNRLRFLILFATLMALAVALGVPDGTVARLGRGLGAVLDQPFSPVHLMLVIQPDGTHPAQLDVLRMMLGLAVALGALGLAGFAVAVRLLDWPIQRGAFNVWINLPLFDPTTGGDVLIRLRRDGQVNLSLGALMPFLIPALLHGAGELGVAPDMTDPLVTIWVVSLWAFFSVAMMMRGIALLRVADLIAAKRRRAYARADLQAV